MISLAWVPGTALAASASCGQDGGVTSSLTGILILRLGEKLLHAMEAATARVTVAQRLLTLRLQAQTGQTVTLCARGKAVEGSHAAVDARRRAASCDLMSAPGVGHGVRLPIVQREEVRHGAAVDGELLRQSTVVSWYAIQEAVESAKGRRLLFLDTCHAGNAYNDRLGNAAYYANILAYSSARSDQEAMEQPEYDHGLFISSRSPVFASYAARCKTEYTELSPHPEKWPELISGLRVMWRTEPNFPKKQYLASVRVPTVLCAGEYDEIIKRDHMESIANTIPNSRFMLLPEVSHFAMLQNPLQFNRAVNEFLVA